MRELGFIGAMNRSFRAPDREMQAAVAKQRQQMMSRTMIKDKDEELALFMEMRKREKERNSLLVSNTDDLVTTLGIK